MNPRSDKGSARAPFAPPRRTYILPIAAALILVGGTGVGQADARHGAVVPLADSGSRFQAQGLNVLADVADCAASVDGTARYFVSVRSSSGVDILNATGRLIGTGTENGGQTVNMFNGDLEAQADDGFLRGGCKPRPNDGRANDLGTTFVPSAPGTNTWSLRVLAAGYAPSSAIDLAPYVDGTVCPQGDDFGCLISLGTIVLTGVGVPSSSRAGTATPTPTRATPFTTPGPPTVVMPSPTLIVMTRTATPQVFDQVLATPSPTGAVLSPSPLTQTPETTPQPETCDDPGVLPECGPRPDPEPVTE